jgi:hypothetical protein
MVAPSLIWRLASAFAIACCWLSGVMPGAADSILAGTVTDAITLQPIAGAEVQIEYSGKVVGAGTSDIDGIYSVPFTVPPGTILTMIASARSGGHVINRSNFQMNAGTPVSATHNIRLYPIGVMDCRSQTEHSVIVGHFLPADGRNLSDLSARIARSLEFALNTRLQTVRLTLELLPSFEPCDAAKPRTARLAANFAKELRADAFVGGDISAADGSSGFTVSIYVSDAHGLFSIPESVSNRSVDLSNPSGASIGGETHAAVLASIAAGLAGREKNDCVSAIAVLSVAERLVDVIPPYITTLRKTCESRVPNAGLRRATQ